MPFPARFQLLPRLLPIFLAEAVSNTITLSIRSSIFLKHAIWDSLSELVSTSLPLPQSPGELVSDFVSSSSEPFIQIVTRQEKLKFYVP